MRRPADRRRREDRSLPVHFLISLRDDAVAKLDFFKGRIPDLMRNIIRLQHLNRVATETAIRKPLSTYNEKALTAFTIEDNLVQQLLEDVQVDKIKLDSQGQASVKQFDAQSNLAATISNGYQVETPYLQLVMKRLWEHEKTQQTQQLSLATLKFLGGVQDIVDKHLDNVMESLLTDEEKDLAAEFIHFTVTSNGTKIPSDPKNLSEWANELDRQNEISAILQKLSDGEARIFKAIPNRRNPQNSFYKVTHDALGPAILSWRKRRVEDKRREEAESEKEFLLAEDKRKQKEAAESLEREREEKERQLRDQRMLLDAERNSRRLGRIAVVCAFGVLALMIVLGIVAVKNKLNKKNQEQEQAKEKLEAEQQRQARAKEFEERLGSYKALLEILVELRSKSRATVNIGLNRLKEKASLGQLPDEFKPLFEEILKNSTALDNQQKDAAIQVVKDSKIIVATPDSNAPLIVFMQIQKPEQRSNALKLESYLETQKNYVVPGIENVGERPAIKIVEVRYFRPGDAGLARDICGVLAQKNIAAEPKLIGGYENSSLVRPKQFEIWFSSEPIPDISEKQ